MHPILSVHQVLDYIYGVLSVEPVASSPPTSAPFPLAWRAVLIMASAARVVGSYVRQPPLAGELTCSLASWYMSVLCIKLTSPPI